MHFGAGWTLSIFHDRLNEVVPQANGLSKIVEPAKIDAILQQVLKEPLVFVQGTILHDSLWWFRGDFSLQIEHFQHLRENQYLMGDEELNVKEVTVYLNDERDFSFLYLSCAAVAPALADAEGIRNQLEFRTFAYEEVGYIPERNIYVDRFYAEEGYMMISDEEKVKVSEVRTRYLTPYNLFIAPKESRLNNTGAAGSYLSEACDRLLGGTMLIEEFIPILQKLPVSGYRQRLLGTAS